MGVAVDESKRHAILLVHANAVPALLDTFERFEPVAGRRSQIAQFVCRVQNIQLPAYQRPHNLLQGPHDEATKAHRLLGQLIVGV
jgi:hypothetical protein